MFGGTDYSHRQGASTMIGPRSLSSKRPQLTPVVVPRSFASTSSSAASPAAIGTSGQYSPTAAKATPPTPLSARLRTQLDRKPSTPSPDTPSFSPASSSAATATPDPKGKRKANPLEDLIETETLYVADLGVIIKRVAAAWSRSNFPPPELDTMFRAIEAVYRTNKALLTKLNDIGPSPSSPKALGDLLMGWVVEIEPSYSRFASSYCTGFDSFPPIRANAKLQPILDELTWPKTLSSTGGEITLDCLFSLPVNRISYYKKLFSKLLKSTKEGKSDHALLVEANQKLDRMAETCRQGSLRTVSRPGLEQPTMSPPLPPPPPSTQDELNRAPTSARMPRSASLPKVAADDDDEFIKRDSNESAQDGSEEISFNGLSSNERFSSATSQSNNTSATTLPSPTLRIDNLERKLNCDRTLDIFTMQPRKCKLQISPPTLRYRREIRRLGDITIYFTPSCDPQRREITTHAHVILLSDLLLICQRMAPDEGMHGQEMWLLYPPLSGRHLTIRDEGDQLRVGVMQREWLVFAGIDWQDKEQWRKALEDAISFSNNSQPALFVDDLATLADRVHADGQQSLNVVTDVASSARSSPSPTTSSQHSMFRNSPSPLPSPLSVFSSDSYGRSPALAGGDGFDRPLPKPNEVEELQFNSKPPLSSRQWDDRPLPPQQPQQQPAYAPAPPRKQSQSSRQFSLGLDDRPLPPTAGMPRSASASDQFAQYPRSAGSDYGSLGFGSRSNGPPVSAPPARSASKASNGPGYGDRTASAGYAESVRSTGSLRSLPRSTSRSDGPLPSPARFGERSGSLSSRAGPPPNLYTLQDRFVDLPPVPRSAFPNPQSATTDPGSRHLAPPSQQGSIYRSRSAEALSREGSRDGPSSRFRMPSSAASSQDRLNHSAPGSSFGSHLDDDDFRSMRNSNSPPLSPVSTTYEGPTKTTVTASMKCKAFLQHGHAQWKSLGLARLQLFVTEPGNTKQLVVESDKSDRKTFVSTIVLTDGVERVGKTGVAIELSDNGSRTGIVYMLQLKNEHSATGLFEQLLRGSDRSIAQKMKHASGGSQPSLSRR